MASGHSSSRRLVVLVFFFSISTSSAKVPAIIVFGDSTADTGNNNAIATVAKSNFRPYGRDFMGGKPTGRFCNGRIAADFISEGLGLPPTVPAYLDPAYSIKDFATGVCFASAGTGLDNATSDVLNVIPLWKEVEYFKEYKKKLSDYLGHQKAKFIIQEAVYLISIGSNDFIENYFILITGRFKQYSVEEYEDFLVSLAANFIRDIYRLGARKISFISLGALGCLPLERTTNILHGGSCIEEYNKAAREFNGKMKDMTARLCARLPGLRLRFSDIYEASINVINNPSQYGYENVEQGCCGTGLFEASYLCDDMNPLTCQDADKYYFWDSIHPTERVYRGLARLILDGSLAEFVQVHI